MKEELHTLDISTPHFSYLTNKAAKIEKVMHISILFQTHSLFESPLMEVIRFFFCQIKKLTKDLR